MTLHRFEVRALSLAVLALITAQSAQASGGVALRAHPTDENNDGKITLGEVFTGAGAAADVVIAEREGEATVLDAGKLRTLAHLNGVEWRNPKGLARVVVFAPTGAESKKPRTEQALIFAHAMNAGQTVEASDLTYTDAATPGVANVAPTDPESIVGMSLRRPMQAGALVLSRDLAPAQVIHRDDLVSVTFSGDGLNVTMQGKALKSAAQGEMVAVLNPQSKKTIYAVATAPGQAVIDDHTPVPSLKIASR